MALDVRKRRKRRLDLRRRFRVNLAPRADQLDDFVSLRRGVGHLMVYHR